MSEKSSGTYVIDPEYNVISVNQTLKEIYPQLEIGKKCYQCLMNLEEPCPTCPVANNVKGPQTYMDPIRQIYETVDAVDMVLQDGRVGHALVMSTVGESAFVAAKLPRTKEELTKLLEQQYFDPLTGGFSRKGFIREAGLLFQRANPGEYAIAVFDIHNFKAINDIFGVEGGDQVLRYVFETLKNSWLRPVVSARIESDWFLFLVNRGRLHAGNPDSLLNISWSNESRMVHLHLRCGIYNVEDADTTVTNMIEWATLAKEFADEEEYGNVAVFNESMRKSYVGHAEIISGFQTSIRNEEFKVYYQPIVRASDGKICSAEALVRWIHPKMGFIVPNTFIPALEKSGLISQLDRYVLGHVFDFQKELQDQGLPLVPVSVNLSRQDFYNDHLMNDIFDYTQENSVPKGAVNFEVTETSVAVLRQNCSYLLQQIQQSGAKVLLDDFGSGYSSLGMIGDYSFDIVKIDKTFIDQIEFKPTVRAVITSTIDMCHRIGLQTVAEGVENEKQLSFLRRNHCDFIQGYYFSKPLSEEDFRAYLLNSREEIDVGKADAQKAQGPEVDFENLVDLIDHAGQFIQVCHPEDYTMVFANAMTTAISGHPDEPYEGRKCYQYMLGLDAPCGHCPMKKMGNETEKNIEVDDGEHVFNLKGRYTVWNGRKVFIEYGRDVTDTKIAQKRYTEQIRSILETIPEGQGVFHMDLTDDRWLSSGGNAQNARRMQNVGDVDTLIRMIGSFVPDRAGQEKFFSTFSRKAQMNAYAQNHHQIVLETLSYYDDRSIRWSRITAQLIDNPNNGHVESILYGVDISKEKAHLEEMERERRQSREEKEELQKEVETAWDMYNQADRDRRYDCLTGLNSRLDLYDAMDDAKEGKGAPITAVMMLDLDDFKNVNDTYGHAAGDQCLKVLGKKIRLFGEQNDITFYRFGGEEIVGIYRGEKDQITAKAEDLLDRIRKTDIPLKDGKTIAITASIGYTTKICDYQEMISGADRAMYAAKKNGKDRVICLDS